MPPKKAKKAKPLKLIDALKIVADGKTSDKKTVDWLKSQPQITEMKTFPTFVDGKGLTMLMWAADKGKLKTVQYLIDKGANPKQYIMKDKKKWDAYELAIEGGYPNVANFLRKGEIIDLTDEPEKRLERRDEVASMLYAKNVQPPRLLGYEVAIEDFINPHRAFDPGILLSTQESEPIYVRSDSDSTHVSATPPRYGRSDSETSHISGTPQINRSNSGSSMGSLRLSQSPSLFSQLSDEPVIL